MKKWTITVLSILLILSVMLQPAYALQIDTARSGSVTATMADDGRPVPGGTLTIYQVADLDLSGKSGYRLTDAYQGYGLALDNVGPAAAIALATYTYEKRIEGRTQTVDENGMVCFDNLDLGLYLLIQWESANGYYHLAPFLVSVPNHENGVYVYDVTCVPKQEPIPEFTLPTLPDIPTQPSPPPGEPEETTPEPPETTEPTETVPPDTTEPVPPVTTEPVPPGTTEPETPETTVPEPTKPSEPQLPQTGQNHWPVPVLAVGGIFFLILGGICISWSGKKYEDA